LPSQPTREHRRLRVACFAHLSEISGAITSLLAMAQHLDPSLFDAVFVIPGPGPIEPVARASGVRTVIIQNSETAVRSTTGTLGRAKALSQRVRYLLRVAQFLRSEQIDLVFISSVQSIFAGLGAVLARKPIVWHVHETIVAPDRSMRLKLAVVEHVSSGLFYDSESGRRAFPARRVKRQSVQLNWLDMERLVHSHEGEDAEAIRALGLTAGSTFALCNGVIPRKGADMLLRAASKVFPSLEAAGIQTPHLVITGACTDPALAPYMGTLHELAASLEGKVHFAGVRYDMAELLRQAGLYVSPSRNEALPITMVEAMAAGTPVIATDVGDCRVFLEEGRLGAVVPPDNAEALAAALREALEHPHEARQRAALAQQKVVELYKEENFFKPLEAVLLEVAREAGAQVPPA
jgi:glycosyltransferase involved in cell wall biosynthesis